jgi:hypothetical protein
LQASPLFRIVENTYKMSPFAALAPMPRPASTESEQLSMMRATMDARGPSARHEGSSGGETPQ